MSDGTWNYTYDAMGNLVKQVGISNDTTWTYTYNDANRMTLAVETVTSTGAVEETATYVYDVLGNLLSETVTTGGITTVSGFAYTADGTLYADVNSAGTIQTRYVAGVGGPDTWLARVTTGGGGAWLLSDYQGSVMLVVGLTGGVQDSIIYDGFGNITSETDPSARGELGFQGGRYDAGTGNWVFGLREENPETQNWTTQDPSGLGPDSNPYRFVGNDPTNATDPSGLRATLTATALQAPQMGRRGGFYWPVRFTVGGDAPNTSGTIVQHVVVTIEARNAKGDFLEPLYPDSDNDDPDKMNAKPPRNFYERDYYGLYAREREQGARSNILVLDYWEAWPVKEGKVQLAKYGGDEAIITATLAAEF